MISTITAIPRAILPDCARRLSGLPVLFVGIRCPIEVIMERRRSTGWNTDWTCGAPVPQPVRLWQQEIHRPGLYDLELDTALLSPDACAAAIRRHLEQGPPPAACQRLAAMATD